MLQNRKRRLTALSILIMLVLIVITAAFFRAMTTKARMETDLDEYMPNDHPAFVYSNNAEEIFNIKDGIIIAIENTGEEGIYNYGTLDKVKRLTKALQKMKEIHKDDVTSLVTADNIVGTETGLDVKPFYKKAPSTTEKMNELRENVRNNDMVFERLVSKDETVTVIIAEIEDSAFSMAFYNDILELANSFEGPENIYVAGTPIVEGTMAYLGPKDMKKMVPIVIVVIILVLLFIMRSIRNTILTLLVVLFSTIWAFGLMAALGVPIYSVTTMIPIMLIAIGVADGIHLFSHADLYLLENPKASKYDVLKDMLQNMWKPVVVTSVTTGVGFISLITSQVYPIKYFGLFTAFGVMMAMVFSLVLIPAGIYLFGVPRRKLKKRNINEEKRRISYILAEKTVKYKAFVVGATGIILFISVLGIENIWINSSFLEKFERDSDIVLTDAFINEHFGGTSSLNVILEAEDKNAFKDPVSLKLIDDLQNRVEEVDQVGNSFSISDYLKRMNKVMHADDENFNSIPDTDKLVAQYMLLYEMSGDPENLWKVVDYDYKKASITIKLKSDNSKLTKNVVSVIEEYKSEFEKRNITINYAGSSYKALVFTDLILEGQIQSLLLSFVLIIALLSLMFKNIKIGFIGSIPIVITAIVNFGIMGLLDIALSTTTALTSSIAVGIGIDYAVHFIERYKIYAHETNDKNLTIKYTMHHSGRAIVFNAIVVIAGFMVLLTSVFPPNRQLGAMVSLNMFTSFLCTVTIMFLFLYNFNLYFKREHVKSD